MIEGKKFGIFARVTIPFTVAALGAVACAGDEVAPTGKFVGETPQDRAQATQKVSSPPSNELPITSVPSSTEAEISDPERAIINLGDWEMAITGWEEVDSLQGGFLSTDPAREADFKYVVVDTYFRNVSANIANTQAFLEQEGDFDFRIADSKGELWDSARTFAYYTYEGGLLVKPYIKQANTRPLVLEYSGSNGLELPPGFGVKVGLIFAVGKEKNDYGLAVEPKRAGLANPHGFIKNTTDEFLSTVDPDLIVRRGQVAQNLRILADNLSISPAGAEFIYTQPQKVNSSSQTFSIKLDGLLARSIAESGYGGMVQRLGLTVANISSQASFSGRENVDLGGESVDDVKLTVYLKDGRVIPALYGDIHTESMQIGDSLQAKVTIASTEGMFIGTRGWDHPALHGLLSPEDLDGAIVVLVAPQDNSWIAWELPDSSLAR